MKPKVSIIIPVYRVEAYVERCVKSLFTQTLDDLEYIFIDDFGGDKSIDIIRQTLDLFPERKDQVKFIYHPKNMGVSRSRQDGIDIATGEYIIHCDPDDWVEPEMYKSLYNKAKSMDADLVICDYTAVTDNETRIITQQPEQLSNLSVLESISGVSYKKLHGGLVNKLIRSGFYHNARFPSDINYCEDVCVLFQILQNDLKISYINKSFYNYKTDRPGSICKTIDSKALDMDKKLMSLVLSYSTNNYRIKNCIHSFIINTVFYRAFLFGELSDKEFCESYKIYFPFISCNNQIHRIDRILLKLAMKRNLRLARQIHFQLLKIKNYLRKNG